MGRVHEVGVALGKGREVDMIKTETIYAYELCSFAGGVRTATDLDITRDQYLDLCVLNWDRGVVVVDSLALHVRRYCMGFLRW